MSRAQYQEEVLAYQQTVQNALEQVSNALVADQKDREFREQQELLTRAAQRTDELSEVLYKNGGASYLQVLTAETNYFSAELNLVQAQLNKRWAAAGSNSAAGPKRGTTLPLDHLHACLLLCDGGSPANSDNLGKAEI